MNSEAFPLAGAGATAEAHRSAANLRGAAWMTTGMAGYVVNDALIKRVAEDMPLFQAIFLRGLVVTAFLYLLARSRGDLVQWRRHIQAPVVLRVATEMLGTICYLLALTNLSLSNIVAILQVVPLAVTLAAAWLLKESVGWRRYLSVLVGFGGVLLVVRPGSEGFTAWSLLALLAVTFVVIREMATRRVHSSVPSLVVALGTAITVTIMGAVVSLFQGWSATTPARLGMLLAASVFLGVGYIASVITIRTGEVSFTAPFRYTVLVFALILQIVIFGETPDALTLLGSAVIAGAGLYAFARERTLRLRTSAPLPSSRP